MGWAENRMREIQHGAPSHWLERRMMEHANPVHFPIAVAASLGLMYGLWTHRWGWIVGSCALAAAGHAYCWTRPEERPAVGLGVPGPDEVLSSA